MLFYVDNKLLSVSRASPCAMHAVCGNLALEVPDFSPDTMRTLRPAVQAYTLLVVGLLVLMGSQLVYAGDPNDLCDSACNTVMLGLDKACSQGCPGCTCCADAGKLALQQCLDYLHTNYPSACKKTSLQAMQAKPAAAKVATTGKVGQTLSSLSPCRAIDWLIGLCDHTRGAFNSACKSQCSGKCTCCDAAAQELWATCKDNCK